MDLTHVSKTLCLLVCWLDIINYKASFVDLSWRSVAILPSFGVPGGSEFNCHPQVAQSQERDSEDIEDIGSVQSLANSVTS